MTTYRLVLPLASGATFARGVRAPWLDIDTEWDPRSGLPFVRKSVVRQALVEACADALFALRQREPAPGGLAALEDAAEAVFGGPGSLADAAGSRRVGRGLLPAGYVEAVEHAVAAKVLAREEVLDAHTSRRPNTAVDRRTGAAADGALRTSRLVLRGRLVEGEAGGEVEPTRFAATVRPGAAVETDAGRAVVAAAVAGVRRLGLRRRRGRGRLGPTELRDPQGTNVLEDWLALFDALAAPAGGATGEVPS